MSLVQQAPWHTCPYPNVVFNMLLDIGKAFPTSSPHGGIYHVQPNMGRDFREQTLLCFFSLIFFVFSIAFALMEMLIDQAGLNLDPNRPVYRAQSCPQFNL